MKKEFLYFIIGIFFFSLLWTQAVLSISNSEISSIYLSLNYCMHDGGNVDFLKSFHTFENLINGSYFNIFLPFMIFVSFIFALFSVDNSGSIKRGTAILSVNILFILFIILSALLSIGTIVFFFNSLGGMRFITIIYAFTVSLVMLNVFSFFRFKKTA